MKSKSSLLWALGINGEGSSHVTFAFIKHICMLNTAKSNKISIIYTASSSLDRLISSFLLSYENNGQSPHVNFIRLPKFSRNYLFHFLLKATVNPNLFFDSVVVFDDFPFKRAAKQVLYFHQPNLIYNASLIWRIKRSAFKFLLSPSLAIYVQTCHMRDSFLTRFGQFNTICFLHSLS
jgi:hypothetical protein